MKKCLLLLWMLLFISPGISYAQTRQKQSGKTPRTTARAQSKKKRAKQHSGSINGHEYVDLGLPSGLRWATCNVGADSPSAPGLYYAWSEAEDKESYAVYNSDYYVVALQDLIDYSSENLLPSKDTATTLWSAPWRMPSRAEWDELLSLCKWTKEEKGYTVTGPNGKTIFLPNGGWSADDMYYLVPNAAYYWSSSIQMDGIDEENGAAWNFADGTLATFPPYFGLLVRPVSSK